MLMSLAQSQVFNITFALWDRPGCNVKINVHDLATVFVQVSTIIYFVQIAMVTHVQCAGTLER